jgi:electron transfer flavoprotein alpha/beta subunit
MDTAANGDRLQPRSHVNYALVMKNERDDLVAVGPVSIEYQAAMLRDELEETLGWTTVGIARVVSEEQARSVMSVAKGSD